MKNKQAFKTLFLDSNYQDVFENYCKRKKLISENIEIDKCPLTGIKKLFILLTLFEYIDSDCSIYDYSRIIELGLVSENCILKNNNDNILEIGNYSEQSVELLKLYKKDVVKYIKKNNNDRNKTFLCVSPNNKILSLENDYEELIQNCNLCTSISGAFKRFDEGLIYSFFHNYDIEHIINIIKSNLTVGLYYSDTQDITFASSIFSEFSKCKHTDYVDNIYYTIRTQLPNEVNILPMPQTLNDVLKMRKSPYITSFRNTINEWSIYIEEGNLYLAKKIEKDLVKANKMLERLEKYKKFSQSPYCRVFNLLGSFIPYLSNVLSITSFAETYIIDNIQQKYGWTLITKK